MSTPTTTKRPRPLDPAQVLPGKSLQQLYRLVRPAVEWAFDFPALWRLYDACAQPGVEGADLARAVLARLGVTWSLPESELAELRATTGPLIIVSNHPFGGLDSLAMIALLDAVRPGTWRMLSNQVVCAIPELRSWLIPLDPLGRSRAAQQTNRRGLAGALRHLQSPDALLNLLPAGRVSHWDRTLGAVCDRPWNDQALRLARRTGATVVCLHVAGRNSRRFLAIPRAWSRLRALALARELVYPSVQHVQIRLAAVLTPTTVQRWLRDGHAGRRLRAHCFAAADRGAPEPATRATATGKSGRAPLASPVPPDILREAVDRLDPAATLLTSADDTVDVLLFRGGESPVLLNELGRCRELTFRAAGQGTGLERDVGPEDDYYHHLVLWHRAAGRIIGAYRLGFTQEILETQGPGGLYLDHVFAIAPEFYRRLGPAIELSRSFIVPEHQRDNQALGLLWRGLGLVAMQRQTPTLFGSVTISNEHHPASRACLVGHLRRNHADHPDLCRLVRARRPFRASTTYHHLISDAYAGRSIDELAPLIERIEHGRRGIPPLMRYYCSLGARYLAYHVEAAFQDALYCLLRVDLTTLPPAYRRRFLPAARAAASQPVS